jgi:hypothetical protein
VTSSTFAPARPDLGAPRATGDAAELDAGGGAGAETIGDVTAPTTVTQRLFRPGWPLAAILVPFPLWWALGVSEWIVPVMVVPMALDLLRRRSVLVPRGFGWWMAFLLWVVAGVWLLQVDALGAVADDSRTRLITFAYRLGWYVSITTVLLYVVNTRRELSTTRIVRIVACLFITVTLGGVLGVVAPYFQFKSLAELVLPSALTNFQLIRTMIHPQAAQLMGVLGYVSPRPSAPYAFTNTWGLNFAVTLPFFLWAWTGKDAGWRRWAAGPVILVAAVPFVYSINRGMWGACVAMALFVAVRAALTGRPGVLAGIVAGAAALAVLLAVSPLGHIVALRFSNEGSEQGRTNLGTLAVRSVTATSPVVGLGSTRNVQGNFQSITGGSTAQCPRCSPPSLGTQGQLWLVVFSQGLVGLVLFLTFFALVFLRHIRLRSPVVTMALCVMVGWVVTMPVYNSLGTGMLVLMVAVGLLCREGMAGVGGTATASRSLLPLGRYVSALRAGAPVIVVTALVGVAAGAWWMHLRPSPYEATASVLLTERPRYPSPGYARTNVDTDAQLIAGRTVREAAVKASGESPVEVSENLTVTATPNTRVLHLHLTAASPAAATAGVDAATAAFLRERTAGLEADRAVEEARLRASSDQIATGIDALNAQVVAARAVSRPHSVQQITAVTRDHRNELLARADLVARQYARIKGLVLPGGSRTAATEVTQSSDNAHVDLVSGGTAGIGVGGMLAVLWGAAGPRLRRVRDVQAVTGLPLLARASLTPQGEVPVTHLLADQEMAFVAATEVDATASAMADRLADSTDRPRHRKGAVVVASERTRVEHVLACQDRLTMQGIPVHGVVLTAGRPSPARQHDPQLTDR